MHQRGGGAARLSAVWVVVLSTVLLVGSLAPPAEAASRLSVSVSRTPSATSALPGDPERVTGRASRGASGSRVYLQRQSGTRWITVVASRLTSRLTYQMVVPTARPGRTRYRVMTPATTRLKAGVSSSFVMTVLPCDPGAAPTRGVGSWYTRNNDTSLTPITRNLARLFCAATPGSTIDVAMYFISTGRTQADSNYLLDTLGKVRRYRGVTTNVVLEGKFYPQGLATPSLAPVRRVADLTLCNYGCHNSRPGGDPGHGIMHQKFVTVTDTSWTPAVDPVVVVSSANWSANQLRRHWQNAQIVQGDPVMFREFDLQWQTMMACAGRGGCATWNTTVSSRAMSPTYALVDDAGLWRESQSRLRLGSPGAGTSIVFSPWSGSDALVRQLRGYRCTPEHGTVRISHMFVTSARQNVVDALAALRDQGCRVSVLLTQLTATDSPLQVGVTRLRAAGMTVRCVPKLHDKLILVDAVRTSDGLADKSVWVGSQSLGSRALRANEETMLRFSTAQATGAARYANAALHASVDDHWQRAQTVSQVCG